MNKYNLIFAIILSPLIVLSQNVEVIGGLSADSINLQSGLIKNVGNPISEQDAATKSYVDAATSSPNYTIGLSPEQGGYIFWVSENGKHGLVAETIDQNASVTWYIAKDVISNPVYHSIDGKNFRDWRLPTKTELEEMYLHKNAIGGFSSAIYWSSLESSYLTAYWKAFSGTGSGQTYNKTNNYAIRAVRAF